MINFGLAKEIYGITPWMMDIHSIPVMASILKDIKNGVQFETPEERLNSAFFYDPQSETRLIYEDYQLRNSENFSGIGLINLNGPITLSGGSSSMGMEQLSQRMLKMSSDSRVKSFIILTNSGGGSSSAVELMVDTINEVKQSKPVYALISKGGMACSAAYGIISPCTQIFSESPMNVVGSVGTMVQFEGRSANSVDASGVKSIRLYATKSTRKNEGFEKALNEDNYEILINELLDPINENFIEMISLNRPKVKGISFDDGATHLSKNVIGTLIDAIATFKEVVAVASNGIVLNTESKEINTNINNEKMTKEEFKIAHPSSYAEIVAEGVAQERDQVGAWLAHVETDSKAVVEGISSGKPISQSQREVFFVKQNSKNKLTSLKSESADDITADESLTSVEKINQAKKEAEVKAAFEFELK